MRLRNLWVTAAVAATATLAACNTDEVLSIENTTQPDVERSLSTADGIEAILRNGFQQIYSTTTGSGTLTPAMAVMSLESYGSVANFGMNLRATFPRVLIDNTRGNATAGENFASFESLSLRARTIANAINALDNLIAEGGSLGSTARDLRARSFGFMALGLANGELALTYDSVAVVQPGLGREEVPELSGYQEAMTAALAQMDSAIANADAADAAGGNEGFPLPSTFLRTTDAPTSYDEYVGILHSIKARLRANVARTPEARAAVDWAAVVADAAAGITENVTLALNSGEGWGHGWLNQAAVFQGWHNMTPYIMGMADTTSGYANWIAAPRGSRTQFLIITPDERFPAGDTRAAQQASSPAAAEELPEVYFRNRGTNGNNQGDTQGEAWGNSYYDHVRFRAYRQNNLIAPWVWMSKIEIDMLQAEGLIRLNRADDAMVLVNASRVENKLPAFTSGAGRAPAHPGGSATSCVPRTPTGPEGTLECGTLLEAMKWEKRMETAFTGYGPWFFDSRGWGDLPVGTPTMWPVPFQEMDARRKPFYDSQSGTAEWQAQSNTYGFGVGSR